MRRAKLPLCGTRMANRKKYSGFFAIFCQIMGIANILKGGIVEGAYIRCPNPDDEALMFRLNLYHEVPKKDEE